MSFNVYDIIRLEWTSNLPNAFLVLWCDHYPEGEAYYAVKCCFEGLMQEVSTSGYLEYSMVNQSYAYNRKCLKEKSCHFDLLTEDGGNPAAKGPGMGFTSQQGVPATFYERTMTSVVLPTSSSTITSSMISTGSTISTSGPSSTDGGSAGSSVPSSSNPESSSTTLSAGAVAGISVGSALGVASVIAFGILGYRHCKKRRERRRIEPAMAFQQDMPEPIGSMQELPQSSHPKTGPAELEAVTELEGDGLDKMPAAK
ncbi:hypothetical protein T440DRAFT_479435 [Plenodomus tracheiphilus IPT5]|uniref:Uncharacterized protein n=1 Tax=Plenodomus tracheiphilus IPT5 TaxID=1408161 RepID=A0A6A7B4W5_9PLEO|nr:hypothetical protein T440DRAFT_479435 [Plenodomus tracheiphilus IPT5]